MGAVEPVIVPIPRYRVAYGVGDVTAAIDDFLVRLVYTDHLHGKADEVQFQVHDLEGAFKAAYWPQKGDDVTVSLGYDGGDLDGLWPCGTFTIDEVQADGPPDSITIKALSSSIKLPLRQKNNRGFEGTTLKQVAAKVAGAHGLTLSGTVPDVRIARVTQHQETDLGFLRRLAEDYGCICKVQAGQIVFHHLEALLGADSIALLGPEDIVRYSLRSKTADAPRSVVTRYYDPATRSVLAHTVAGRTTSTTTSKPVPGVKASARETIGGDKAGTANVLKLLDRNEDMAQADARAQAALVRASIGQVVGTVTIPGDPRMRAGMSIWLDDAFGKLSGPYLVEQAAHTMTRAGYETALDVSVNPVTTKKPKKTPKKTEAKKLKVTK